MDFSKVLVTDHLAVQIFAAADRERLLFSRGADGFPPHKKTAGARQRALSLFVLFDHVIVHDHSVADHRLPDLEKSGLLEVVPRLEPHGPVQPIRSRWKTGPLDLHAGRGRPKKKLLESLALLQESRQLVLNRLVRMTTGFDNLIAKLMGVSRRQYLDIFIDYATAYVRGDEAALTASPLSQVIPSDLLKEITDNLFSFTVSGDEMSALEATLLCALICANEIRVIQELSAHFQVGVATQYYRERFRQEPALEGRELDAVAAVNHFLVLRAALAEEGRTSLRIDSIKHALALREDPYLKAMRDHLSVFHEGLLTGDRNAVVDARRAVAAAHQALRRKQQLDIGARWVTYLVVPVAVVEVLLGLPPVTGMSLSVVSAGGTAAAQGLENKNSWVLFGG